MRMGTDFVSGALDGTSTLVLALSISTEMCAKIFICVFRIARLLRYVFKGKCAYLLPPFFFPVRHRREINMVIIYHVRQEHKKRVRLGCLQIFLYVFSNREIVKTFSY